MIITALVKYTALLSYIPGELSITQYNKKNITKYRKKDNLLKIIDTSLFGIILGIC